MPTPRTRRIYTAQREYIRLEGDAVSTVVENVTKTVSLENFMAACKAQGNITTPILSNGTKYYCKKDTKTILIVEKPPQTKTVTWKGLDPDESKTRWKLAFPYTVYIFGITEPMNINTCRVYYRTKSITVLTDMLCRPNLGNLYNDYKVCTGYSNTGMRAVGATLAEKVDDYIAAFWHSEFNVDLLDHWNAYARNLSRYPQLISLDEWQKATVADPLFPLNTGWTDLYTIEALIREMMASSHGDA
jgi:hypothetical protein